MIKTIALSRPATSAIAAFLVLSTPAAFAQEAPTMPMTPPVAAPAPAAAPTAPETGPAAGVTPPAVQPTQPAQPQPVIRVPLDIAPAATAPAAAEPAPRTAPRTDAPTRAGRNARQAPAATAAAPAATAATAAPAADEAVPEPAGAAPPAMAPSIPTAEPAASSTGPATPAGFPWELVGGAAALIALGGAGLVLARRRRVAPGAADTAEPSASATPVARSPDRPWVTPAFTAAPARSTPAFAAAPSGSIGRHEAMAMAGPTPDNPFLTLSKRLKRARFFDRQERHAYARMLGAQKDMVRRPVGAWEISQHPTPAAPPEQEIRRPEPARGHRGFRPGFSRS